MRPFLLFALLTGCTLINDPASHMGELRDAPPNADVPTIPLDDFCDQLAELYCGAIRNCCMSQPLPMDCVATSTDRCDATFGRSLLRDARTGYDETAAAAYLAEGHALASACSTDILVWQRSLFTTILDGIRSPGSDCTPEMVSMGFDYAAVLSCEGPDYACIFGGIDRWTCASRVGEGAGCYFSTDCLDGLYCDASPGFCRPRLTSGSPCTDGEDQCVGICFDGACVDPGEETIYCYAFFDRG